MSEQIYLILNTRPRTRKHPIEIRQCIASIAHISSSVRRTLSYFLSLSHFLSLSLSLHLWQPRQLRIEGVRLCTQLTLCRQRSEEESVGMKKNAKKPSNQFSLKLLLLEEWHSHFHSFYFSFLSPHFSSSFSFDSNEEHQKREAIPSEKVRQTVRKSTQNKNE